MAKNYELPVSVLKFNGVFDLDGLYRLVVQWFDEYGFLVEEPSYKHKVPSALGAEQEMEFTAWKKITEYARYWIEVFIHMYDLKDVEVIKNGVKHKMQTAELQIEFSGHVETDYPGMVDSNFRQYLKDFWDQYLLKRDMDSVWTDQLWYIIYKLHTRVKEHLGMETYPDPFKEVW